MREIGRTWQRDTGERLVLHRQSKMEPLRRITLRQRALLGGRRIQLMVCPTRRPSRRVRMQAMGCLQGHPTGYPIRASSPGRRQLATYPLKKTRTALAIGIGGKDSPWPCTLKQIYQHSSWCLETSGLEVTKHRCSWEPRPFCPSRQPLHSTNQALTPKRGRCSSRTPSSTRVSSSKANRRTKSRHKDQNAVFLQSLQLVAALPIL